MIVKIIMSETVWGPCILKMLTHICRKEIILEEYQNTILLNSSVCYTSLFKQQFKQMSYDIKVKAEL